MPADTERWNARAARARFLAESRPAAAEALLFFADLIVFQQELLKKSTPYVDVVRGDASALDGPPEGTPEAFVARLDRPRLRALVPPLLSWVRSAAPRPLAATAAALLGEGPADREKMFKTYWQWASEDGVDIEETRAFVVEAVVQPFAERLAMTWRAGQGTLGGMRCPSCKGRPVMGLLREAGQGARRSLLCGLCRTEWRVPRIVCPACGEDQFDALPVMRTETFPGVHVDGCSSCHTYVKTVDLTHQQTPSPEADDLASLPLDIWAREQGFWRVRPHLLRV